MLRQAATYEEVCAAFEWPAPARYNIALDTCDKHADTAPDATALIHESEDGAATRYSFRAIQRLACRAANLFAAAGIRRGDRVGILLGQAPETLVTHLGCWRSGIVSLPLFTLFGEDALAYRLANSGARALVTDRENHAKVAAIRDRLPALEQVFLIDGAADGAADFHAALERADDSHAAVDTSAEDPAFLAYTSGTTGPPKGALHAHRSMLGHIPGFALPHEFFGRDDDLCWSPADWAWLGGLMDVLMPCLWFGRPVVAFRGRGRFDPERAYEVIARHRVRNLFMVPTMLKLMRQAPVPREVSLRTVISGGETVGIELLAWGRERLGLDINEIYGQTECNLVLAHVPALMAARPGSLGRPSPGHVVGVIDEEGRELGAGEEGEIACRRPDPVIMLEYWRDREATAAKYAGDWLRTGDLGRRDDEGYFWFKGRADDVITTSGYRVGPGEIEDSLIRHPAVALAAVIGVPDPVRTEIIKAFIVPSAGAAVSAALADEFRQWVRTRLAAHEYPREIEFVDQLPTTATGKIMRRLLRQREVDKQKN